MSSNSVSTPSVAPIPPPLPLLPPQRDSTDPLHVEIASEPEPCLFLEKLIPEVRIIIYEHVIGGQHIHLKRKRLPREEDMGRRMNRYREVFTPFYHRLCHGVRCRRSLPALNCGDECLHTGQNKSKLNLSLLRACKQIYVEVLPILYSKNTFEIDGRALGVWTTSLAVNARAHIAALKITATLKDKVDGREWKAGCTISTAMLTRLKELNVSVHLKNDLALISEIRGAQDRISANQDWLRGILRFEALDLQKVELDFQGILVLDGEEDTLLKEHLTDLRDEAKAILGPRIYGRSTSEDLMDRMGALSVAADR